MRGVELHSKSIKVIQTGSIKYKDAEVKPLMAKQQMKKSTCKNKRHKQGNQGFIF